MVAQLRDRVKIGFIRNPLVRVLSGFRDKVLRKGIILSKGETWGINSYPENATEYQVFSWFIRKLTNDNGLAGYIYRNIHFIPQYGEMQVCIFPYDYLGQVELSGRDIPLIQKLTNTTGYEFPGSRSEKGKDAESTVELANRFWGTLSPQLLDKFYDYYRLDFELLGYSKLRDPNFPYVVKNRL